METHKIAAMAEAFMVSIAPHNPLSPLATVVSLHLDTVVPNFLNSLRRFSAGARPRPHPHRAGGKIVENGYLRCPTGPGWGVELNEEFLARPPVRRRARLPDGLAEDGRSSTCSRSAAPAARAPPAARPPRERRGARRRAFDRRDQRVAADGVFESRGGSARRRPARWREAGVGLRDVARRAGPAYLRAPAGNARAAPCAASGSLPRAPESWSGPLFSEPPAMTSVPSRP